jgi:hypothetical protein
VAEFAGMIYYVVGRTRYGGFFVFAGLCFVGTLLFLLAAKIAAPEIERRRLALILLFWPPLLFWPSSIGKDALMVFALGLAALGAALLFGERTRLSGMVPAGLGVVILLLIRPNMALITLIAMAAAIAWLMARSTWRARDTGSRQVMARTLLAMVLLVGIGLALTQAGKLLDSGSDEEVASVDAGDSAISVSSLQQTLERTSIGNAKFSAYTVRSPLDLPLAVPSVLFRPFPWEVNSAAALLGSLDGVMLMIGMAASWRRLRSAHRYIGANPYLIFASVYLLGFVIGFSNIGNGAILARERSQMLPFVLIVLALPKVRPPGRQSWSGSNRVATLAACSLPSPATLQPCSAST